MRTRGFSLVELSIVLVILGLLTGGILAGRSLIRASELRSVSTEYSRYVTATHAFRDKYFMLPGDINNATSFWGSATCPGTASQGSSVVTCNGGGDGLIGGSNEQFRAWQHLANAGLIEGSYNGVTASDSYSWSVAASNAPVSKLANGIWTFYTANNSTGAFSGNMFRINYGNFLLMGSPITASWPSYAPLKPEEAWNIDSKLDDGMPAIGKVIASYVAGGAPTGCTNSGSNSDLTGTYKLSDSNLDCFLMFYRAF